MARWYAIRIKRHGEPAVVVHADKIPAIFNGMDISGGNPAKITVTPIRRPDFRHTIVYGTIRSRIYLLLDRAKHEGINLALWAYGPGVLVLVLLSAVLGAGLP